MAPEPSYSKLAVPSVKLKAFTDVIVTAKASRLTAVEAALPTVIVLAVAEVPILIADVSCVPVVDVPIFILDASSASIVIPPFSDNNAIALLLLECAVISIFPFFESSDSVTPDKSKCPFANISKTFPS